MPKGNSVTPALSLTGIRKTYDGHLAVAGLDLDVAPGEFVTLLGPSGCGKSTTLGVIAGFFEPDAGDVKLHGQSLSGQPPFRRDIGVVFQDYALFPHMSVADNVGYGLRVRNVPPQEIRARVNEMLALVRLDGLGERMPQALSGGQKQRVALARALVINPKFLLLDEPLSNLDLKLREDMRLEIVRLQRQLELATIFVTHDQTEALAMSDRIVVMKAGQVEQIGTPKQIYREPANRFVAEFIGSMNLIDGVIAGPSDDSGRCQIQVGENGATLSAMVRGAVSAGQPATIAIRPERCRILPADSVEGSTKANRLPAKVSHVVYLGSRQEIHLSLETGTTAVAEVEGESSTPHETGADVILQIVPEDCLTLPS